VEVSARCEWRRYTTVHQPTIAKSDEAHCGMAWYRTASTTPSKGASLIRVVRSKRVRWVVVRVVLSLHAGGRGLQLESEVCADCR